MDNGKPKSLKRQNRGALATVLLVNLAAFAALARGGDIVAALERRSFAGLVDLVPVGALALLTGLLNSQLSPNAKARVVFLKWADPLPACRAFSYYVPSDPRIDASALGRTIGEFPETPRDQNGLWYRLYRAVAEEPSVSDSHQQFLLWRDSATLVALLAIVLVPGTALVTRSATGPLTLLALLGLQFGLMIQAARVHAERLVCNVLAITASASAKPQ
jgi:hypothetical protein